MKKSDHLYLGSGRKEFFDLPAGWRLALPRETDYEDHTRPLVELINEALDSPFESPTLERKVANAREIVIIVDDGTRPTPVGDILAVVLGKLNIIGIDDRSVRIVVALGSHSSMSEEALRARLGGDVVLHHPVIQHNAWQANMTPLQVPSGMSVKVNPIVASADFKIGISSILPHPFAGYGGGPKILMPGVCDVESLARHHMAFAIHPRARIGVTEGNPFYESCMEIARAIGLDFSINCIYNKQGQLTDIVSGSLNAAFNQAEVLCRRKLGCHLKEKVDVTILSTYPHTHGIQFCKGLCTPSLITKETGTILMMAPLVGSLPEEFVDSVVLLRERYGKDVAAHINQVMSKGHLVFGEKSPEYNMALYDLLGRRRPRTLLVSRGIPAETISKLGLEPVLSLEEGIKSLKRSYPSADVAVFPSGGLIVPLMSKE